MNIANLIASVCVLCFLIVLWAAVRHEQREGKPK
jgi:hypothetical protein